MTGKITNIYALHNLGQNVLNEDLDLMTHKLKMKRRDKPSTYSIEDDHLLPDFSHYV